MLTTERYRDPPPGMPLVLAIFSFRYDAHLVPGLIANLRDKVHGHVAWDDRSADAAFSDEPARRNRLLSEARRQGAEWILAVDPDERLEDRLAERLPEMVAEGTGTLWSFDLREMFTPDSYRIDGVWGGKTLMRLFPVAATEGQVTTALHGQWVQDTAEYTLRGARVNLYHFRMASAYRRRMRRALYAAADPGRQFQHLGYDYLDDDRGMVLQQIPEGRGFTPLFEDDGGLWAPNPGEVGNPAPDPYEARLTFAGRCLSLRLGQGPALGALADLAAASPQDPDFPQMLARTALRAGNAAAALDWAGRVLAQQGTDIHAHLVRAQAAARLGDRAAVAESVAVLETTLGPSPLVRALRTKVAGLDSPDALWRRWVSGPAHVTEGRRMVRTAEMAVVVPGYRSQPGLRKAVASLLAQDTPAEIVVVNSGGGDVRAMLDGMLDRIRLIAVEEPLFVGAARNIGVDASRAPFVAFLAGDCTAGPGWIAARLSRHRAGAAMVSTPVLPEDTTNLPGLAAHYLRYSGRHPQTPEQSRAHFGRSFARWVLQEACPFPPGLRVGEDDYVNHSADRLARAVWAADVMTLHPDPSDLASLLAEERARGARKADHAPYRGHAVMHDAEVLSAGQGIARLRQGARAAEAHAGLGPRALHSVLAMQWLAHLADRAGLREGQARIAAAAGHELQARALRETDPAAALAAAEAALALDGQDWRKALLVGELRVATGKPGAEEAMHKAWDLSPSRADAVAALCALRRAVGDLAGALHLAEEAILRAPGVRRFWDIASDLAAEAGQPERCRAWRLGALALAPQSHFAHRRLALAHAACGDQVAAAFRNLAARRLKAWEDRKAQSSRPET